MKPCVAINYSPAAAALRRAEEISFDLWKAPFRTSKLDCVRQTGEPFFVHFGFDADDANLELIEWSAVDRAFAESASAYINIHLKAHSSLLGVDERRAIFDQFMSRIEWLGRRFGIERVLAENVTYRGAACDRSPICVDPEFISDVVHSAGCGFLLDLAHAAITCGSMGMPLESYIVALPGDRLREIHVTGVAILNGRWRDGFAMSELDWDALADVLHRIDRGVWAEPWCVTLESGGIGPKKAGRITPGALRRDTRRLASMAASEHASLWHESCE